MSALLPGLSDLVFDSQAIFRAVMDAMARPGSIHDLGVTPTAPPTLPAGAAAVLLALADFETPVFLGASFATREATEYLAFHAQARCVDRPEQAQFAVVEAGECAALFDRFDQGTPNYPDRSATLIVTVDDFQTGTPLRLTGPGIRKATIVNAAGLSSLVPVLAVNRARFPLGLDILLVSGNRLVAFPRSVRVEAA
jgi:alpha-D-ribose 1-methylphosphonate 5-triphosphate synthase subunit PhnH